MVDESGFVNFSPRWDVSCGQTGSAWGKFTVLRIIFFVQLINGAICDTPGVEFLPQPDQVENANSTLIWYSREDRDDYEIWTNQLETWFNDTNPAENGSDIVKCSFGGGGNETYRDGDKTKEQISSCFVDKKQFGPCSPENRFGYHLGEPCVLLKLDRVYGWEPKGFGLNGEQFDPDHFEDNFADDMWELEKDVEYNPQEELKMMPRHLKDYIRRKIADPKHSNQWKTDFLNSVFLTCEGETILDKENIGPLEYYPGPYIPSYYFPFRNQPGYQTPFIMMQLKRPWPGVLINIVCLAWAKHIRYDRVGRLGMLHFEMMMD